jgi:hypothetical protein
VAVDRDGAYERTKVAFRALLQAGGFALHGVRPMASPLLILEAAPV